MGNASLARKFSFQGVAWGRGQDVADFAVLHQLAGALPNAKTIEVSSREAVKATLVDAMSALEE